VVDTRERILQVATGLFAKNGVEGTSIRMIAAEAEANQAAVNYHFGSKDQLFETVVRETIVGMRAVMEAAVASPGTYTERFRRMVRDVVEGLWARRQCVCIVKGVMLHGGARLPPPLREEMARNMRTLAEFVAEGMREETLRRGDPRLAVVSLMGSILHAISVAPAIADGMGLDLADADTRAAFAAQHADVMLRGLQAAPGEGGGT
jgi:AcrR family transcriptional regulator